MEFLKLKIKEEFKEKWNSRGVSPQNKTPKKKDLG